MILASIVNIKEVEGQSNKEVFPSVDAMGAITKWMSDPPPMAPMKPTLQDRYHRKCPKDPDYCNNLESQRLENRVNTPAYQPNIDFLRSQNCFALNYQWPSQITLPSMAVSLNAKNDVDIYKIRASAPSGCFVILVGGKYVKRLDDIVRKVDFITSQLAIKLVTYFAEKTEVMPVVDLDNSPAIVRDTKCFLRKFILHFRFSLKSRKTILE